jgi:hypothetical protein
VHFERRDRSFGNGRFVRNLFERIVEKQANRIAETSPLTDEILCTITKRDIPEVGEIDEMKGGDGNLAAGAGPFRRAGPAARPPGGRKFRPRRRGRKSVPPRGGIHPAGGPWR